MGRTHSNRKPSVRVAWTVVLLQIGVMLLWGTPAMANPEGGVVVGGSASISSSGSTLNVNSASQRAVINWQGFSINNGEVTNFNMPNSNAAVLNRVVSGNPSAIYGALNSNGKVYLINPNGIMVGPTGQINVNSFVASTLNVPDTQFMNNTGELNFAGTSGASIVNHGQIRALEGDIYLIGASVQNHGGLYAPNGVVGMAAGQDVRLVDSAHPHLTVPYPQLFQRYKEAKARYERETEELARDGRKPTQPAPAPPWKVGELYNGMISPLVPVAIRGAIWYQGEANVSRAWQYRTLLPELIRTWRNEWRNASRVVEQGNFTFLTVQLAPFGKIQEQPGPSAWAELREAQLLAARLPKAGTVVITDVGDENDLHPVRKEPVGARLAIAARGIAYGEKLIFSGPTLRNLSVKGDKAQVTFNYFGTGLDARGGPLRGFSICGDDQKFVWAKAFITGTNIVTVSHPDIKRPVAVRYGWADYPLGNLWNRIGLPASPFRTDDFPLTTRPADGKK